MVKVLDNVKLYFSFLKASLKEMLIYRLDCIVGMVSQIVTQLVEIIFIWIVFQNTEFSRMEFHASFIIIWNNFNICRNI